MDIEVARQFQTSPLDNHRKWNGYLEQRIGTYDFRCRRYRLIADILEPHLTPYCTIVDVGGGRGEFGLYMRDRFPEITPVYIPIDGSIDGIDLDYYVPSLEADFYVSIEVMEHLSHPRRKMQDILRLTRKIFAITTPNPACTDVLGMDETRVHPITDELLKSEGFGIRHHKLFTSDCLDTTVAWAIGEAGQ